ncbi:MAG TPA: AAA family ATPase [Candidatus Jacksonbacteria bacterium]|uniref:Replication-associated recombination protein A n=1 Tax=candidate division CPR1 bacterium GW2011_GWA2_42_17 TaxID=1618341 RepID=A0A0G0Z6K1_9BACT|nr:MAG: ATPase, AAA family protein [candidate division CPR1 bacterium GW2011_GWA2_42_17]HAZ16911.1 AAA family ATPase [Candidatus Jacksonbacteria bacterium]
MNTNKGHTLLADRMRPRSFEEFVGQDHILSVGKMLRKAIESDQIPSMIFWGPPGCGKTTLAKVIANITGSYFVSMSAVTAGVKDVKKVVEEAHGDATCRDGVNPVSTQKKRAILFLDEIHRFNKAQQDVLLPHVEDGTLILIGATTENPSFEVNSALLSRCRVFVLNALEVSDIETIIKRALADTERGLGTYQIDIDEDAIHYLATMSNGDARIALNALELSVETSRWDVSEKMSSNGTKTGQRPVSTITKYLISESLQRTHLLYDQAGEEHYTIISALHKSMRGGDANAAMYWLGRMLEAGEDPLYIARRLIRFASEDIGIANSFALPQAVAAYQACHDIGMPECNVVLAQAVVYMAKSKKSNALYTAYKKVQKDIAELPSYSVPLHLRNAPTKLMKNLGYGKGYKYTPEYDNPGDAHQDYLPEELKNKKYLDE